MSLSEESDARKLRLLALRKKREGGSNGDGDSQPVLSSRNFDPASRTLRKRNLEDDDMNDTVEKNVEGVAEAIVAQDEETRAQELDLANIAPKRANWDLKREMNKKMEKLERRTQEAIHTLIRQRLAAQKDSSEDLLGAINAQNAAGNASDSDEDV